MSNLEDNPNCIFCQIIAKKQPAKIIFENDTLIIFEDIRPAAKFHYLVVPKKHIKDVKHLVKSDISLLNEMVNSGKNTLENGEADMTSARFGFHWPPFDSVPHLHLHVISPTSDLSFLGRLIFRENSYWFVSPEYVHKRLSNL